MARLSAPLPACALRVGPAPSRPLPPPAPGALALACALALLAPRAHAQDAVPLPPLIVTGQSQTGTGPSGFPGFGNAPLAEVPASIGVLRARDLRDEGARTWSAAIRGQPAAADAYNTVGFVESVQLRGFVLDGLLNYRRNGLPVSNYMPLALENKERIEVLKGVNAVVSGLGSPGGTIDVVTKRAPERAFGEMGADVSERGTRRLYVDVGDRVAGDAFGWRLNAAAEQRRPAARDADGNRVLLAGAADWRGAGGLRADVEFEVQHSRQVSVPGLGLLDTDGDGIADTLPPPLDPRLNLNSQPWSQAFDALARVGSARLVVPLAERWTVNVAGLAQSSRINDRLAFPDGCSSGPAYVYPGLCGNYDVDLYDYRSDDERRTTRVGELALDGSADLLALRHVLRLAVRSTRYAERYPAAQAYNYVGTISALAPVPVAPDATPSVLNTQRDLRLDEVAASDSIALAPQWTLWGGLRWVRVRGASAATDGSNAVDYTSSGTAPWLALSWRPAEATLLYASYGTSYEVEAVPNRPDLFVNPGQLLPPLRSTQFEVGWRTVFAARHTLSLAAYEIRRPGSGDQTQDDGRLLRVADAREARHRGLELEWRSQLDAAWAVQAAATLIDARIARADDAALAGQRATNVPRNAANAQLQWRAVSGLQVVNRVSYAGERAITRDNAVTLPAWWQWDAWLVTPLPALARGASLRAGIDNVTDRRYWREAPTQSWGGTYVFPAAPRTLRLELAWRFA